MADIVRDGDFSPTILCDAKFHPLLKGIYDATVKATEADAKMAEAEWKRVTHEEGSPQFSAMPSVNLRPAGAGVDNKRSKGLLVGTHCALSRTRKQHCGMVLDFRLPPRQSSAMKLQLKDDELNACPSEFSTMLDANWR